MMQTSKRAAKRAATTRLLRAIKADKRESARLAETHAALVAATETAPLANFSDLNPMGTVEIGSYIPVAVEKTVLAMAPYTRLEGVAWFVESGSSSPKVLGLTASPVTIPAGTRVRQIRKDEELAELKEAEWFTYQGELFCNLPAELSLLSKDSIEDFAKKLVRAAAGSSITSPMVFSKFLGKTFDSALPPINTELTTRVAEHLGMPFVSYPLSIYRSWADTYWKVQASIENAEMRLEKRAAELKDGKPAPTVTIGSFRAVEAMRNVAKVLATKQDIPGMSFKEAVAWESAKLRACLDPEKGHWARKDLAFARSYLIRRWLRQEFADMMGLPAEKALKVLTRIEQIDEARQVAACQTKDVPVGERPQAFADAVKSLLGEEDGIYNVTISKSDITVHKILVHMIRERTGEIGFAVQPSKDVLPECLPPSFAEVLRALESAADTAAVACPLPTGTYAKWSKAMDAAGNWKGFDKALAEAPNDNFVIKGQYLYGIESSKFLGAREMLTGVNGRRWMDLLSFDVKDVREIQSTQVGFADISTLPATDAALIADKKHPLGDGTIAYMTPEVYGNVLVNHDTVYQGRMVIVEKMGDGQERLVAFYKGTVVVSKHAPNVISHKSAYGRVEEVSAEKLADGTQRILMFDKANSEEKQSPGSISDQSVTFNGTRAGYEAIMDFDYAGDFGEMTKLAEAGFSVASTGAFDAVSALRGIGSMKKAVGPSQFAISAELYLWSKEPKDQARARKILASGYDSLNVHEVQSADNFVTVPVRDWKWFDYQRTVSNGNSEIKVNLNRHPFMAHGGSCHTATVFGKTRGNFYVVCPRSYSLAGLDFDGDKLFATPVSGNGGPLRSWSEIVSTAVGKMQGWLGLSILACIEAGKPLSTEQIEMVSSDVDVEGTAESENGVIYFPEQYETSVFVGVHQYFSQGRKGLKEVGGGFGPRLWASVCNSQAAAVVGQIDVLLRVLYHGGRYLKAIRMVTVLQAFIDRQKKNFAGDVTNPAWDMSQIIQRNKAADGCSAWVRTGVMPKRKPPVAFSKAISLILNNEGREEVAGLSSYAENLAEIRALALRASRVKQYITANGMYSHFEIRDGSIEAHSARVMQWIDTLVAMSEVVFQSISHGAEPMKSKAELARETLRASRAVKAPPVRTLAPVVETYYPRATGLVLALEAAATDTDFTEVEALTIFDPAQHTAPVVETDKVAIARELRRRLSYALGKAVRSVKLVAKLIPSLAENVAEFCTSWSIFKDIATAAQLKEMAPGYEEKSLVKRPHLFEVCPPASPMTKVAEKPLVKYMYPTLMIRGRAYSNVTIAGSLVERTLRNGRVVRFPRFELLTGENATIELNGRTVSDALNALRAKAKLPLAVSETAKEFVEPGYGFVKHAGMTAHPTVEHDKVVVIMTPADATRITVPTDPDALLPHTIAHLNRVIAQVEKSAQREPKRKWAFHFNNVGSLALQLGEILSQRGFSTVFTIADNAFKEDQEEFYAGMVLTSMPVPAECAHRFVISQLGQTVRFAAGAKDSSSTCLPATLKPMHLVRVLNKHQDLEATVRELSADAHVEVVIENPALRDHVKELVVKLQGEGLPLVILTPTGFSEVGLSLNTLRKSTFISTTVVSDPAQRGIYNS